MTCPLAACRIVIALIVGEGCGHSRRPTIGDRVGWTLADAQAPHNEDVSMVGGKRWGCYELIETGSIRCVDEHYCDAFTRVPPRSAQDGTGPCRYLSVAWCFSVVSGSGDGTQHELEAGHPMGRICTDVASRCERAREGFLHISGQDIVVSSPCTQAEPP